MNLPRLLPPLLSIAALIGLWHILSLTLQSPVLPAPLLVLDTLTGEIRSGQLQHHLGATLFRLVVSFVIAMSMGSIIGIALGMHEALNRVFDAWVTIALNVPALVTIILCYVWFGLNEAAAVGAVVINKLPNVIVTFREGGRTLDRDLMDMARAYRFGWLKTLRHVIWPQLFPFAIAAARTGIALIWKIILIVEIMGRSDGMGYQLHLYFQMFNVAGILAYTCAFIVVMQLTEYVLLKPLDARAKRWRK